MLKILLTLISTLFVSFPAHADAFDATKGRTLYIRGFVGAQALDVAGKIIDLTDKNDEEPIDLVINSPGGSIYAGMQILSAMTVAQARGVTIRCFVPVMAASMAFAILAQCDERYALPFTMLLWHPGKQQSAKALTKDDLEYGAEQLKEMERDLSAIEMRALKISPALFNYHYVHETMWFALSLKRASPGFMTIVDDFTGVDHPFVVE